MSQLSSHRRHQRSHEIKVRKVKMQFSQRATLLCVLALVKISGVILNMFLKSFRARRDAAACSARHELTRAADLERR